MQRRFLHCFHYLFHKLAQTNCFSLQLLSLGKLLVPVSLYSKSQLTLTHVAGLTLFSQWHARPSLHPGLPSSSPPGPSPASPGLHPSATSPTSWCSRSIMNLLLRKHLPSSNCFLMMRRNQLSGSASSRLNSPWQVSEVKFARTGPQGHFRHS